MSAHGGRRQGPDPADPFATRAHPARRSSGGLPPGAQSPGVPSPGGPSGGRPDPLGPAQLGWALLIIAAALIGGLAAAALVHTTVTTAVIVSVVAGGLAIAAVFRSPARPPGLPPPASRDPLASQGPYGSRGPLASQGPLGSRDPYASQATRPVPPASFAPAAPDPGAAGPGAAGPGAAGPDGGQDGGGPPGPRETAVQLLPLAPQPGQHAPDSPWWDSPQGAPSPSSGSKRAPAPDLSTYLASTFIAQCPRCGAFRLDIQRARTGWDIRCEACEHAWTWQPGTPWPPVRVLPRARRE